MRGLTLIETVLYLALLAFLMASVWTIAGSFDASDAASRVLASDEGAFIVARLEWAATMAAAATLQGGTRSSLVFTMRDGGDPVIISFDPIAREIVESEGGNAEALSAIPASGFASSVTTDGRETSITASFSLGRESFSFERRLP